MHLFGRGEVISTAHFNLTICLQWSREIMHLPYSTVTLIDYGQLEKNTARIYTPELTLVLLMFFFSPQRTVMLLQSYTRTITNKK